MRGKSILIKKIEAKKLFVTRADKGGATLIVDWDVAVDSIKHELGKPDKFVELPTTIDGKMMEIKKLIITTVCDKESKNEISPSDRKLITGVNDKGNLCHSHVFIPTIPYAYPLYKIHKLSQEQIRQKVVPPCRLVHATKQGPLYRLEKWCSPYLTNISRSYCDSEFILDTPDLLKHIENLNNNIDDRPTFLFTLDVISLYPSIIPEIALEALSDACANDESLTVKKKMVLQEFTELILSNSFITFENKVYVTKEGIPTGNCISRQVADCHMHYIIMKKIAPQMKPLWNLIGFWRRFIDDIIGKWYGTIRQFNMFVKKLNELLQPFGIQVGDQQIGKDVAYLEVKLYLDANYKILYRLYVKETDARLFLQRNSYHPNHVFSSVVFSQMIRVISRNSQTSTCQEDLTDLKNALFKSGHLASEINEIEPKAYARVLANNNNEVILDESNKPSIVFSVKYSKEIDQLKKLIHNLEGDIKALCGEIRVIFALRKHPSIGNTVVRNRRLSMLDSSNSVHIDSQRCHQKKCKTDNLLFEENEVMVNGQVCKLDFKLNCRDNNLTYLAKCQICPEFENAYFGQTVQVGNKRMSGHRDKFVIDNDKVYEKSALSMHCYEKHPDKFDLNYFKIGFVKKVNPLDLDREEDITIHKFKTNIWGLNRIKVKR